MTINALNSGAMAFRPTSRIAIHRTGITRSPADQLDAGDLPQHIAGSRAQAYSLNDKVAVLIVRPRGWHLDEKARADLMASACPVD